MNALINAAFDRSRTVLIAFGVILIVGGLSYLAIPKESSPDIPIPIFYVSVSLEGVSPEDSERLLVRPLETELQAIDGLDQMTATASEGHASIMLEFDPGFDADSALADVREAVDRARVELPADVDEPNVTEVNIALFPVLTVMLTGSAPERTLVAVANELQDRIEALPGVLEVDIGGDREEVLEVIVDPVALETYDISFEALVSQISRNNRLVAAGSIDTGAGRIALSVPGVIEDLDDVLNLPVVVDGTTVVSFEDVATVRRTYRDAESFARINGQPAIALEIRKRSGANIIETISAVRAIIEEARSEWPDTLRVEYLQDESEQVRDLLGDLENNVLAAIILVMIVVIATLGARNAFLVGLAIPGSFLAGIAILSLMGVTLNIIVLFSLILVVGMLVDGAIVTIELASRRLSEGASPKEAYSSAAKRMAWPIISSTATTLAVFFPLLFWTGMVGEFMKFLPLTVVITLSASLLMALVFVPVLGGWIGRRDENDDAGAEALRKAETGNLDEITGLTGVYLRTLKAVVKRPAIALAIAVTLLIGAYVAYGAFGRGVEFFPSIEPEFLQVQIQARDNLAVDERDAIVRRVEDRLVGLEEIESVYSRTISGAGGGDLAADVVGVLQLELVEWDERRRAVAIISEIRGLLSDIPGIRIQVREQEQGPTSGRPVQIRASVRDPDALSGAVDAVRDLMTRLGGFVDVEDSRAIPGVEWELHVDRSEAARFGADITLLGQAVQLVTVGIPVAEYRPDDADEELDIRIRYPESDRTLAQLERLRIRTNQGLVPIANFVEFSPAPVTGSITRIDARRVAEIEADVAPGLLLTDQLAALREAINADPRLRNVDVTFAGEAEDQAEAGAFLMSAFGAAIFLMLIVLVTQFNSVYQAGLILSAIVFSTAGVMLGLLITGRPFGVVMGGIGIIALAGIVVNNNIVLIDTYNDLRRAGMEPIEAVLRTGAQRIRPVLLTAGTTILGLMPMVLGMNLDIIGRSITFGAPSAQWWTELSSAIAGGLAFATVLTLILTPALLMLGERIGGKSKRQKVDSASAPASAGPA